MRREQLEEYTRQGRWVRSAMYLRKSRAEEHMSLEDTLRRLGELGVTEILEVGPGKALSGFVKKTLGPDVPCTAVETAEELAAFLTKWKEAHA